METKRDSLQDVTSAKSPLRVELSEKLFNELAKVLNEIHSADFSLRFWKLMTVGHVNAVVSRKSVLEEKEYFRKPNLESFNSFSIPGRKEVAKRNLIRVVKYFKMRPNKARYQSILRNSNRLLLGFPKSRALENEELGVELPGFDRLYLGSGDGEKRKRVNRIAVKYDDIFMRNVVRELPKILIEHFQKTYDSIVLHNPEDKIIHIHLKGTLYNDFMLAKYVEHGAKLYWYQHGSEYGEFRYDFSHHYSHDVSDRFRTWGWEIKERDEPWKAYRLETFKEEYDMFDEPQKHELLICYPEFNFKNRHVYEAFSHKLFSDLDRTKYSKILARPRRSNKLHSHASQLHFISDVAGVEISSGLVPMMKEMRMCGAVVQINVPSTNFLECLYVDHPTIGILDNDQPTDIVKPYYEFFKENGVLHDDVESLVAHLNSIDLDEWWEQLINEDMYRSYKETFTSKV